MKLPFLSRPMVPLALCLTLLPTPVHQKVQAQSTRFHREAWLQDFETLKAALEGQYSNLAWFASPQGGVDLPRLNERTLRALKTASSDDEARSSLLAFVAGFHDGHFSRLPNLEPATTLAKPASLPKFPYARDKPKEGCAALGYNPEDTMAFSLPFEGLADFELVSDGYQTPIRAGIYTVDENLRLGLIRLPEFEDSIYPSLCLAAWKGEVWDDKGHLDTGALRDDIDKAWYRAIADLLQRFKSEQVNAVLVDVGRNGGGGDSGDISARLFTSKPLHSAPLMLSQNVLASKPYFEEQLSGIRHAAQMQPPDTVKSVIEERERYFVAGEKDLAEVCSMSWVWAKRRDWNTSSCKRLIGAGSAGGPLDYLAPGTVTNNRIAKRLHWPAREAELWGTWSGPLYVLTDGKTYSSAEMFAAVLQNNHAAKTIGMQTGGDGCGFMDDFPPTVLPNSHLRFRIPNCVRLREDGTDEVAGVKPDIPVLATEGENSSARAVRLIRALEADLEQTKGHLRRP